MIKKLYKVLIIIIISVVLLTGCWDLADINNKCITLSIGLDNVDDMVQFTGEIAKIKSTEKKGEDKQDSEIYTMLSYGKTFEEARINYDSVNPFPAFLGATRVVIFGTNFAKKGIEPYLNRIDGIYDYRKTLLTVVSKNPPKELFEFKVEKDISVGFLIEDIVEHLSKKGQALQLSIGEILSEIARGHTSYMMPYVGVEDESIKYLGLAVMKNSKFIGVIELEDTDGALYLLAKNPTLTEIVELEDDKKNKYSFRTTIKNRKIKTNYIDEKIFIDIDMDLNAELRYQYYTCQVNDKTLEKLEKYVSKEVEGHITSIIKKSQEEYKCDFLNFKKYFRVQYPKIVEKLNWDDKFIHADVKVNVKTKIINKNLKDPGAKKKF